LYAALILTAACAHQPVVQPDTAHQLHPAIVETPPFTPAGKLASVADIIEKSLPGVVLLINYRPDGKVGYGAGIIVDDGGRVLTNLHVVANAQNLAALLFDPERVSYTPEDGGLSRYLFEYSNRLIGARLVRGDPTVDLAIVEIDADTRDYPKLEFGDVKIRHGEQVFVLGHPKETVWSFTSGYVSAVHHRTIQHDAAVNVGNSGGPLLNTEGKVIGINTSRLFGGADGVGFARPISMASRLVDRVGSGGEMVEFDLSTPEKAARTCARAVELASPDALNCIDWEKTYGLAVDLVANARNISRDEARALIGKKDDFIAKLLKRSLAILSLGPGTRQLDAIARNLIAGKIGSEGQTVALSKTARQEIIQGAMHKISPEEEKYHLEVNQRFLKRHGLKVDTRNTESFRQVFKMGVRVDKVEIERKTLAWISITGRNMDGSQYRLSQLRALSIGVWRERPYPSPEELASLPKGWPPPLYDYKDLQKVSVE
jgi:S1-C subfamily serine protease